MTGFLAFTILGLFTGAAYSIAASGLVLTYATTRVFNIAHGAMGMVMSFVFWDFGYRQGLPIWLSLFLVLFVVAPAFGWFVQRFLMRGLGEAPVRVSLVVSVGLFVGLIGLAQQVWPPAARSVQPFFPNASITVAGVVVTGHQILTILLAGIVALLLYVLLNRTRIGTAMRASVDNPTLLQLFGGRPEAVAALSWAIGSSLAALAGILICPVIGLDYYQLTLLVINAYAAAMLGRLTNLPLTFVGAMALGILQSYAVGYLPSDGFFSGLRACVPTVFLMAIIIGLPTEQLRIGQVKGQVSVRVPALGRSVWVAVLAWVVALVVVLTLSPGNLLLAGTMATYAIVMLSMVLLTGYGGYLSLSQFTFAGVGAVAYIKFDHPSILGVLVAAVIAGFVGALVALPTLRLTGLYLALSTLAFAVLMDKLVFQADFAFGTAGFLTAPRLTVLGREISSNVVYVMLMIGVFLIAGVILLAGRRGTLGRLLIAMRDSPAACGTLGLDQRWFRVGLFGASAGIAGFAGALFAGLRGNVAAAEFDVLASLPLLLVAVVCGVTSVTGAALGGFVLAEMPVISSGHPNLAGMVFLVIGFGAVALGRNPNGLANFGFIGGRWVWDRYGVRLPFGRPYRDAHEEPGTPLPPTTLAEPQQEVVNA